jgi:hypothetical protein
MWLRPWLSCWATIRREPSLRYGLKDQFASRGRKLPSATEAREFPLSRMSELNVVYWPVLNHQRAAIECRATRRCGNSPIPLLECLWHNVLVKDFHVPFGWLMGRKLAQRRDSPCSRSTELSAK